jgi:hypothetical protein
MEKKEAEEKNKEKEETKAASVEEKESAEAIASEQEKEQEIANMLEKAEAEEVALPNGAVAEDSLRQKFAKAFNSNTIKVENK